MITDCDGLLQIPRHHHGRAAATAVVAVGRNREHQKKEQQREEQEAKNPRQWGKQIVFPTKRNPSVQKHTNRSLQQPKEGSSQCFASGNSGEVMVLMRINVPELNQSWIIFICYKLYFQFFSFHGYDKDTGVKKFLSPNIY